MLGAVFLFILSIVQVLIIKPAAIMIVHLQFRNFQMFVQRNIPLLIGTDSNYASFTTRTPITTTTERISNIQSELSRKGRDFANSTTERESHNFGITSESNLPNVSIEEDDYGSASNTKISNVDSATPNVIEPDINDYDVDVLDDKNVWKPRLVFENKTKTTTAPSVIMKIGPKKTDVELFNIEAAPFKEGKFRI